MTAILLHYNEPGGAASERLKHFYWRRAEGGAGLFIIGGMSFDQYPGYPNISSLSTDDTIESYRELTDGMHARDAKVFAQLLQPGRYGRNETMPDGRPVPSSSAVASPYNRLMPRALTIDEIHEMTGKAGEGASRAKRAGFDGVELMGSSGYIISQFLSPAVNQRDDEYGGSWENRCRFVREMIVSVREAVGPDYPLSVRIAGNEFVPGGNTLPEAVELAKVLEDAGVDLINVTGGWHETQVPQLSGEVPRGGYVYLAEAVKDAVTIPVISTNRHNDPYESERVLALGQADIIGMCRTIVADPDWPNKVRDGHPELLRKCVACNQGCLGRVFFYQPAECLVNGYAGREYLFVDKAPGPRQNLLVVGAGPAGCEFAIRAAERGHSVTIWEKATSIGGQLRFVAAPPGKAEFANLVDYHRSMLENAGVKVVLAKEATCEDIKAGGFDSVVIATGAEPKRLELPGTGHIPVYTFDDILEKRAVPGRHVVIVGGSSVGCETAEFLARDAAMSAEEMYFLLSQKAETVDKVTSMLSTCRRDIAVVDIAKIGAGFDPGTAWPVLNELKRLGVYLYPFASIDDITDDKVIMTVTDRKTEERKTVELPCDTIVVAVGSRSSDALYDAVRESGIPVHNIGDSAKVGKVLDAIRQADDLAMAF